VSSSSVAALAGLVVLLLGLALLARGRRLARAEALAEARETLKKFDDEVKDAQSLLTVQQGDPAPGRTGPKAGLALGRSALERYGVEADEDWQRRPAVALLPEQDRERLRASVAELSLLLDEVSRPDEQARRQRRGLRDWDAALSAAARLRLQGRAALQRGRPHEALPLFQEATRQDPSNYWGWFLLADCHQKLGEDRESAAYYAVSIALWPRSFAAHFNRGLAYLRQNDHARARAAFDEAVRLRPADADAHVNRAIARQGCKDYPGAVQDLTRALELAGTSPRVYFLRAEARALAGDRAGAARDRAEGLRRRPTDATGWVARGLARVASDPKGALADFDEALRLEPQALPALQNKVHILSERLGRTAEAAGLLDRVVALHPGFVPAIAGRGVLLARLGRREPALRDAREALRRDTSPFRLYQVACIYALTSRRHADDRLEAFRLLSAALARGFGFDLLETDRDLDPLRERPEFARLLRAARGLKAATGEKK
jgi:tetratricopeptide (TPR) repeat protein